LAGILSVTPPVFILLISAGLIIVIVRLKDVEDAKNMPGSGNKAGNGTKKRKIARAIIIIFWSLVVAVVSSIAIRSCPVTEGVYVFEGGLSISSEERKDFNAALVAALSKNGTPIEKIRGTGSPYRFFVRVEKPVTRNRGYSSDYVFQHVSVDFREYGKDIGIREEIKLTGQNAEGLKQRRTEVFAERADFFRKIARYLEDKV